MLAVISPAKKLDYAQDVLTPTTSQITFADEAYELVQVARKLSAQDLSDLMHISADLATLNVERFKAYKPQGANQVLPAIQAFQGDVYQGLGAKTLDAPALEHTQKHLRILSGLYGLLRPFDLMQAYRLEMGCKLKTSKGNNLYTFWGTKITEALNAELERLNSPCLLNLASQEYFKAVKPRALTRPVRTINFREYKNGELKLISFNAKKARGLMVRFMAENHLTNPDDLRGFNLERYEFAPDLSADDDWLFTREFIPVAQQKAA